MAQQFRFRDAAVERNPAVNSYSTTEYEVLTPLDLEIHIGIDKKGYWLGQCYVGSKPKHLWYYKFSTKDRLDAKVAQTVKDRRVALDIINKAKQERHEYRHDYVVGDILAGSWGYDQTQVSWYQVLEVKDKMVKIHEIDQKYLRDDGVSALVMPIPGKFRTREKTLLKRVQPNGRVAITTYLSVSKWDGHPKSVTGSGGGH